VYVYIQLYLYVYIHIYTYTYIYIYTIQITDCVFFQSRGPCNCVWGLAASLRCRIVHGDPSRAARRTGRNKRFAYLRRPCTKPCRLKPSLCCVWGVSRVVIMGLQWVPEEGYLSLVLGNRSGAFKLVSVWFYVWLQNDSEASRVTIPKPF
jgi:hypothetical protein